MMQPLYVPASETGKIRVFALNLSGDTGTPLTSGGAGQALGVEQIDPVYVEIFPVKDLEGLGLAGYLTEGCGISADQVSPDKVRLNALGGHIMLVFSRAFSAKAATLHQTSDLTLIATYDETPLGWSGTTLTTDSAKPRVGTVRTPRTARSRARRIGGSIFAVFMVLIALLLYMVIT